MTGYKILTAWRTKGLQVHIFPNDLSKRKIGKRSVKHIRFGIIKPPFWVAFSRPFFRKGRGVGTDRPPCKSCAARSRLFSVMGYPVERMLLIIRPGRIIIKRDLGDDRRGEPRDVRGKAEPTTRRGPAGFPGGRGPGEQTTPKIRF